MEECCPSLTPTLTADDAESLASMLKALAEPARLRIISMLTRTGEVCVCDLTEPLGLSQPTVSHHLKVLRDAGLITSERRGRWVYHKVNRERLAQLSQAIDLPVMV